RRDHATFRAAPHCDRPAAQGRIVALFHARVKGIHVDMDDLADGGGWCLVVHALFVAPPARQREMRVAQPSEMAPSPRSRPRRPSRTQRTVPANGSKPSNST